MKKLKQHQANKVRNVASACFVDLPIDALPIVLMLITVQRHPSQTCFDCPARNPIWASATFGLFVCLECSGYHRRMGSHISFIRSTGLDKWKRKHLMAMCVGGNANAREFFKAKGFGDLNSKVSKLVLLRECVPAFPKCVCTGSFTYWAGLRYRRYRRSTTLAWQVCTAKK